VEAVRTLPSTIDSRKRQVDLPSLESIVAVSITEILLEERILYVVVSNLVDYSYKILFDFLGRFLGYNPSREGV